MSDAFAGESQAHMRYAIFSDVAKKEGFGNIARLFKAISFAELVHASNHLGELGIIKKTTYNLQSAIDGENYEVEEMYPAFISVAKLQDEKGAIKSFDYAFKAEKIHSGMYQKAKQAVDAGKDVELGKVYICPVCGYTHEGEPPDNCPVCGVPREKFVAF